MTSPTEQPAFFIVREEIIDRRDDSLEVMIDYRSFPTLEAAGEAFGFCERPYDVIEVNLAKGTSVDFTRWVVFAMAQKTWDTRRPLSETIAALADFYDVQYWREPTEHWAASYQRARENVEARS